VGMGVLEAPRQLRRRLGEPPAASHVSGRTWRGSKFIAPPGRSA
jgi:hypothetical protein